MNGFSGLTSSAVIFPQYNFVNMFGYITALRSVLGRVRCWCYGRSNCNTAENSKRLYTAFVSGDERHFYSVAEEIDFADIASSNDDLEAAIKISTTKRYPFPSSTTTDAPSTVAPISNTKIASHMTVNSKSNNWPSRIGF